MTIKNSQLLFFDISQDLANCRFSTASWTNQKNRFVEFQSLCSKNCHSSHFKRPDNARFLTVTGNFLQNRLCHHGSVRMKSKKLI